MLFRNSLISLAAAGLLVGAPALAQTASDTSKPSVQKQKTDGADGVPPVGPGSKAYKQKTDGADGVPPVGPGSKAYKQKTDGVDGVPPVGPGSKAYKQ